MQDSEEMDAYRSPSMEHFCRGSHCWNARLESCIVSHLDFFYNPTTSARWSFSILKLHFIKCASIGKLFLICVCGTFLPRFCLHCTDELRSYCDNDLCRHKNTRGSYLSHVSCFLCLWVQTEPWWRQGRCGALGTLWWAPSGLSSDVLRPHGLKRKLA